MRIITIAASDIQGGASRATYRLHRGLLACGQEAEMIVGTKLSGDPTVRPVEALPVAPGNRLAELGFIQNNYLRQNRTTLSNTYFSLGHPGWDLSGHPLVQRAEVINLHWVAGLQSASSIARLHALGKPLVWTLHDQRPFTGGCHYSNGCAGYKIKCESCPQLLEDPCQLTRANLADQQEILPARNIVAVSPSKWLATCARASVVFRESRVETIANSVETDVFAPVNQIEARIRLNLPPQKTYLLCGADHGGEIRKGYRVLVEALRYCMSDPEFRRKVRENEIGLLCFGNPGPKMAAFPIPVHSFGYLESDEMMAQIYSAADLFLLPSLEDNLPNTMLESMSCGTPVIGFDIGGIPELVINGVTGGLVPPYDPQLFGEAVLSWLARPAIRHAVRQNCRRLIERNYSLSVQAARYLSLYQELLSAKPQRETRKMSARKSDALFVPSMAETGRRFEKLRPSLLADSRLIDERLRPPPAVVQQSPPKKTTAWIRLRQYASAGKQVARRYTPRQGP
jgi:glycosyltransferase involved in cell wall biosynthesis